MRVLVEHSDNRIVLAQKDRLIGQASTVNGTYVVPIPEDVEFDIDENSVVLPSTDPDSIIRRGFEAKLATYPPPAVPFQAFVVNPLITKDDLTDLDLAATITIGVDTFFTRAQLGRRTGVLPDGNAAGSVALLPQNNTLPTARPGILISDTIDISGLTGGGGSDEFIVWWKLYEFGTTEDVTSSFGATTGLDDPALKQVIETDQVQAPDLEVYLSKDDGATYTQVFRDVPITLGGGPGTLLRIAFRNSGTKKLYLASYAIFL